MKSSDETLTKLESGLVICKGHAQQACLPTQKLSDSEVLLLMTTGQYCPYCGDPYRCRGVTPPTYNDGYDEDGYDEDDD